MRIELPTEPLMETGLGKPIVLLPGRFENLGTWNSIIHELSTTHKVFVPRLPQYTIPITSERLIDLVEYFDLFLNENGIQKPAVIANNIETRLANDYIKKYPNKSEKLILIGSASHQPSSYNYSPILKEEFPDKRIKELLNKNRTPLARLISKLRLAEEVNDQEIDRNPPRHHWDKHVIYFDNIFHLPVNHQPKLFACYVRNFLEQ
jgi:pimeloyl-ACP methyl ester carboxylesterase